MALSLHYQLILADHVSFDETTHSQTIENIRNSVQVNVYPTVVHLTAWIKIWMQNVADDSIFLSVSDTKKNVLWSQELEGIVNRRPEGLPKGIDSAMQIKFVVNRTGVYTVKLLDRENNVLTYFPLFVSIRSTA
ncbi:hypothetical protein ACFQZE_04845 [Paenibacillus sp. GCM10027627]|uniref:hypothetical protein n=1 Tax=unclassified Paenibacillus TaxID=185978 RepID=UPI00363274EB